MKHTPGPWEYWKSGFIRSKGLKWAVARVFMFTAKYKLEFEANARLIAAAPDLLDALEDMVQQYCFANSIGGFDDCLDSLGLSASAGAMRILASLGRLQIEKESGRRVIAHWVDDEERKNDCAGHR